MFARNYFLSKYFAEKYFTGPIVQQNIINLIASITANSLASNIEVLIERNLFLNISAQSTTSSIGILIERNFQINILALSTSPDIIAILEELSSISKKSMSLLNRFESVYFVNRTTRADPI